GVNSKAILAPQQGVTRDLKGTPTALVVNKDNKVEQRELVTSRTTGAYWLIEKGLSEGDRVITEGLQYVKPGAEVKVKEATNYTADQSANAAPAATGKGE
uniref:HlyD family secretion protein n=1 Tax=Pseudomonas viridiflava TaxID=33069 RepID=UPI0019D1A32D